MIVDRKNFERVIEVDCNPELSWIGRYSYMRPDEDLLRRGSAFFRRNAGRHEMEYFIPAISVSEHRDSLKKAGYSKGVAEEMARQYCREDYQRMESYNRGDWNMVGVKAAITLRIRISKGNWILQRIESPGIWGIESDAGEIYLDEIYQEECSVLMSMLQEMGIRVRVRIKRRKRGRKR